MGARASKYELEPGLVNTNWGPGPINTNLGPGLVNTNWGPGTVNTNWGPALVNKNLGPGPGPGAGKYKYPRLNIKKTTILTTLFIRRDLRTNQSICRDKKF